MYHHIQSEQKKLKNWRSSLLESFSALIPYTIYIVHSQGKDDTLIGRPRIDSNLSGSRKLHDDVIKWKHFPRYRPFVWETHRWPVNSPHKGQWRGTLVFTLICAWIDGWVNNREVGDLRRHCDHYDVTVMKETKSDLLILFFPHQFCIQNPHKTAFTHDTIMVCYREMSKY